jgi:hypothetical protein
LLCSTVTTPAAGQLTPNAHVPIQTTATDQPAWLAFVQQSGSTWDGIEETWPIFGEFFRLGALDVDFEDQADDLVDDLEGRTNAERVTILTAQYGVTLSPTPTRPDPRPGPPIVVSRKRRLEGGVEPEPKRRRSGRTAPRGADLSPPTLAVTWRHTGVGIQKLNIAQAMGFHQVAVLTRPDGATTQVAQLYALHQEVRDCFSGHGEKPTNMGLFRQDKTFKPPYGGESTDQTDTQITFTDDPGWSTTSLIAAGQWLTAYAVDFRWRIRNRDTGAEWVSPTITHTLTCPYADGADAAISATPDGQQTWPIVFP